MYLLVTNVTYQNLVAFLMCVLHEWGGASHWSPCSLSAGVRVPSVDGQPVPSGRYLEGQRFGKRRSSCPHPSPLAPFSAILLLKVTGFICFWTNYYCVLLILLFCCLF